MITRIEMDGFKSLRGFSLDCEPLMAIVGPNSVGKSNLFDGLKLLSNLAQDDLATAFQKGRGRVLDQFSRDRDGPRRSMSLAVELLISDWRIPGEPEEPFHNRLRYEVEIQRHESPVGSGVEQLMVLREELFPIKPVADEWMKRHPDWASLAHYRDTDRYFGRVGRRGPPAVIFPTPWPELENPGLRVLPKHLTTTLLSGRHNPNHWVTPLASPYVAAVSQELQSWRFLHVDALKLRSPSERAATGGLGSDGSNLPTALAALPQEVKAILQADLCELLPGVQSFEIVQLRDEFEINVEFSDGQRLPARVLSDGTLRLLAFLTVLRSASTGGLIAWEEPENGIFPGRLRMLIEKLLEVTSDRTSLPPQNLLNSHSPAVLAALHEHPEALVYADLVRQPDGLRSTRMRPVGSPGDTDRGARRVSLKEIERILDSARPESEDAT